MAGNDMRGTDLVILAMLVYLMWKNWNTTGLANAIDGTTNGILGSECVLPDVSALPQSTNIDRPLWTTMQTFVQS